MSHWNRMAPWMAGAAVVAALLIAFGAPLASLAPFAIVLVCPLMMLLMMGGMAGMHRRHGGAPSDTEPQDVRPQS